MGYEVIQGDCQQEMAKMKSGVALTFLDPPFNQGKDYAEHNDNLPDDIYWDWMLQVCANVYSLTKAGGAIYFMQREKNTEHVLCCLRKTGWHLQNLIIWKKKTSAVPCSSKYGKHYQILAYAIKGEKPRVFNRLRIDPPLPSNYKLARSNGVYVTDVWDDIRELTAGYFAGDEAIRKNDDTRFHKQQSPIQLLLRILLSSSMPGDLIIDPFAGTGTTLVVAEQLRRNSIGIEKSAENVRCITERLAFLREADRVEPLLKDYLFTEHIEKISGRDNHEESFSQSFFQQGAQQLSIFGTV